MARGVVGGGGGFPILVLSRASLIALRHFFRKNVGEVWERERERERERE